MWNERIWEKFKRENYNRYIFGELKENIEKYSFFSTAKSFNKR